MKFLRCGKHIINPAQIIRYRGDGGSTKYAPDGAPQDDHVRTLVVCSDGVRVTFKCSPTVFEGYLNKLDIEILDIPVADGNDDNDS